MGLLFQFDRPALQSTVHSGFRFRIRVGAAEGHLFQETANPYAEPEIGQKEEADQAKRGVNNDRPCRAQQAKTIFIARRLAEGHKSEPATGAEGTNGFMDLSEPAVIVHDVKQAGQGQHQHGRPDQRPPQTLPQMAGKIQQIRQAESSEQERQKVSHQTQRDERGPRQIGAERTNQVVRGLLVQPRHQKGNVVTIKRPLGHQQQQRGGEQGDADDIAETVRGTRWRLA